MKDDFLSIDSLNYCENSRYQAAYQEIWLNFDNKSLYLLLKKMALCVVFQTIAATPLSKWDFQSEIRNVGKPMMLQRAQRIVFNPFSQVLSKETNQMKTFDHDRIWSLNRRTDLLYRTTSGIQRSFGSIRTRLMPP